MLSQSAQGTMCTVRRDQDFPVAGVRWQTRGYSKAARGLRERVRGNESPRWYPLAASRPTRVGQHHGNDGARISREGWPIWPQLQPLKLGRDNSRSAVRGQRARDGGPPGSTLCALCGPTASRPGVADRYHGPSRTRPEVVPALPAASGFLPAPIYTLLHGTAPRTGRTWPNYRTNSLLSVHKSRGISSKEMFWWGVSWAGNSLICYNILKTSSMFGRLTKFSHFAYVNCEQ